MKHKEGEWRANGPKTGYRKGLQPIEIVFHPENLNLCKLPSEVV